MNTAPYRTIPFVSLRLTQHDDMPTNASVTSLSYNVFSKKADVIHLLSSFLLVIMGLPFLLPITLWVGCASRAII